MLDQLAEFMTKEEKDCVDGTHSKENPGPWLKKTVVDLWFMTDTSKMMMIEVLKMVKKGSGEQELRSER